MIATFKDGGSYYKVELLPDGSVLEYYGANTIEKALSQGPVRDTAPSIDKLLEDYTLLEPSLETLTVGDFVQLPNNNKRRVMMAQGVGEYRTYVLSPTNDFDEGSSITFTAHELARLNYTALPWETTKPEAKEMTVADISKELGYEVKVVK